LAIELLVEGLEGVENCDTYKFHFERGYGTQYTTQEQSEAAKVAFTAKSGRAARNQQRQQTKVLSAEEIKKQKDEERKNLVRL
jgi:hypothetical protein